MSDRPRHIVYQIKVMLLGVSPAIWRRLLVGSNATITDLHFILQIAMGRSDSHLHRSIGGIRTALKQSRTPKRIGAIRY